jgi:formiminotetrahydrofolate cyclodeaminase
MGDWPQTTLEDFATALGDAGPVPAAGGAAAATCAFAAGLVRLALGEGDSGAARAGELRALALELIVRDERAYAALVQERGRGDPDELEARREASEPPLEIAAAAAEVAELADAAAPNVPGARRGDAIAAAALARGAGAAALVLVAANLEGAPADEPLLQRSQELAERLR